MTRSRIYFTAFDIGLGFSLGVFCGLGIAAAVVSAIREAFAWLGM